MQIDFTLDTGRLGCGDLVLSIFQQMKLLAPGQILQVMAYDEAAEMDIPAWCRSTGHTLIHQELTTLPKRFVIRKRQQ
jgi:tRNA 2-thiouridine synthesizing protein A